MEKGNRLYHVLDRYAGVPAVRVLSLFRSRFKKPPRHIRRIAIVNLFSIGDNVLMSAAIADLVAAYPDAEMVAFTAQNNYQLVQLIPGFHQVIKLPIAQPHKAVQVIRQAGKFDLVFDFGSWPRVSALYTFFIKGRYKVGFRSSNQLRHYIFNKKIAYSHAIHEIENYRNLIKPFYKGKNHLPKINYIATAKSREFVKKAGDYCIIHPWPGGFKSILKQWDDQRWCELVQRISKYFDTIVLTGAPGDIEKCRNLENMIDRSRMNAQFVNVSGKFNLGETAHILKEAAYVVSIDTGIAHMAAAFHKPLICLQGPADSRRWRPYSDNAIIINPDKGTYGYLSFGFEYHKAKENCMENISVDQVYDAFLQSQDKSAPLPVLNAKKASMAGNQIP